MMSNDNNIEKGIVDNVEVVNDIDASNNTDNAIDNEVVNSTDITDSGSEGEAETKNEPDTEKGAETPRVSDNKKKRKSKLWLVLFVILALLVMLFGAGFITWNIMNAKGKSDLYEKAESTGPTLESITTEKSQETEVEAENDVNWKKGWVRYEGDIYQYNEDILTFLVMGIDKPGKVKVVESGVNGGQADLIILAVFNPHTKSTSLITINRNTMTEIDVYDEKGEYLGSGQGQICLQHGYGDGAELSCERMKKAVSNLFYNLPIHGYLAINMGAMKAINSAVGGVTLTLEEDFNVDFDGEKISLPKGEHTLTDVQAHAYIRYRDHAEFDSATTRLNRQKKYIAAFLSKLKAETAKDITAPIKVFNELSPYIVTDINTSEMTYMVSNTYNYKFDFDNIYSLEGTTAIGKTEHEEFTYNPDQLYDMIIEIFYEKVE